jgi:hypothetical protein
MKTLFDRELTLEEAEALIKNGEDVNQRNHIGRTPLFMYKMSKWRNYLLN